MQALSRLVLLLVSLHFITGTATAQRNPGENARPPVPAERPVQIGIKALYLRPSYTFGDDFKPSCGYEMYGQFRNVRGNGRWTTRMGIFFTSLNPRPKATAGSLFHDVTYQKLSLIGFNIDYSYSIVHHKALRINVGLGLTVGQFHQEYEVSDTGVLRARVRKDELFAGPRARLVGGYQVNRQIEIYAEALYARLRSSEITTSFDHTGLGIGVSIALMPLNIYAR